MLIMTHHNTKHTRRTSHTGQTGPAAKPSIKPTPYKARKQPVCRACQFPGTIAHEIRQSRPQHSTATLEGLFLLVVAFIIGAADSIINLLGGLL